MNPLDLLSGIVPAWTRKWVFYFVIPLATFAYGVWQSVDGDWKAFWPALATAIVGLLVAHPNTTVGAQIADPVVSEAAAAAAVANTVSDAGTDTGVTDEGSNG